MPAKWLKNLEADVSGAHTHMVGVAHAKIDVSNVGAVLAQNAEVISRDQTALRVARNNLDEPQSHLSEGQCFGGNRNSVAHSTIHSGRGLQIEFRAEIDFTGFGIIDQKFPITGANHFAFVNQVSAVHQLESFAHVV